MLQEWLARIMVGGNALVVETDPSQIAGRIFDRQRRASWVALNDNPFIPKLARSGLVRLMQETRRFDINDDSGFDLIPFEAGETYKRMTDIWEHKDALQNSATYRHIRDTLAVDSAFQYKKYRITDQSEIVAMMRACFRDLLISWQSMGMSRARNPASRPTERVWVSCGVMVVCGTRKGQRTGWPPQGLLA